MATALVSLQAGLLVSLLLRGALGEELGLRGFALPRLQRTMSPLRASLVLGVLWGAWHLPVLLGKSLVTVVAFFLVALSASVLSTWVFNGSGGSLLPVLLFHATLNWEEGVETFLPVLAGNDWEAPALLGLVCAGVAAGVAHRRGPPAWPTGVAHRRGPPAWPTGAALREQTEHMLQDSDQDVWEARAWVWTAVFHGTVLASLALAFLDERRAGSGWVIALLSLLLLTWHTVGLLLVSGDRETWRERANARLAVLAGDIGLWFVLVSLSVAFYLALFGLVLQIFRQLPVRQAALAAGLTTAAVVVEQVGGNGRLGATDTTLWLAVLLAGAAIALGAWIGALIEQSTRRRELIAQLRAAQEMLAEAERRAGVLEERGRLAREIHDTLAQGFVSIVLQLEAVEEAGPGDPETARRHLDQARTTARANLDEARRVVQDLRPPQLEQQPVHEAVRAWALRWGDETGIDVTAETTGAPLTLSEDTEVTLLRAAQEALSNVRRHASATHVMLPGDACQAIGFHGQFDVRQHMPAGSTPHGPSLVRQAQWPCQQTAPPNVRIRSSSAACGRHGSCQPQQDQSDADPDLERADQRVRVSLSAGKRLSCERGEGEPGRRTRTCGSPCDEAPATPGNRHFNAAEPCPLPAGRFGAGDKPGTRCFPAQYAAPSRPAALERRGHG